MRKSEPRRGAASKPGMNRARRSGGVQPSARHWSWTKLSIDRKLDIIGVVLALVGLLTLLSLFSPSRSQVTGWWVHFVYSIAGWGSFILPVALILIGVWLVLRNVERLPMLSAERLTGVILLYFNVLAWMHLIDGGNFQTAQAGEGGGYIGAFFQQLTVSALGEAGAAVAFSAWLIIAVALTLDISVSEIFQFIQQILASLARRVNRQLEQDRAVRTERALQAGQASFMAQEEPETDDYIPELDANGQPRVSSELPPDFRPFSAQPVNGQTMNGRASTSAGVTAGGTPERAHPITGTSASPAAGMAGSTTGAGSVTPARQGSSAAHAHAPARGGQTVPGAAQRIPPPPPWKLPAIAEILEASSTDGAVSNKEEEDRRARLIEETLASFGAPVKVVKINAGPTVTQFGVEPQYIQTRNGQTRVRVSKIVALADDLALALAAPRIRIQAPVPGRGYVGIEVPNSEISRVLLGDVMESEPFRKIKSPLRFALGKDVSGHPKCYDLAAMPHLLIAGTTGSGKSVLVNAILTCLLISNTPNELRMILVDPKRVELTGYNGIPHLLAPVIVEAEEVVGALQWVQREMDARYHRFSQVGARNIADYNARYDPKYPYLLVLIDELADLMMLAPDETERSLTRLAQLARATGIHLVLATQRPSVDVVTGLIKANFPARVAFAVASGTDSRVILDQPGAERLLGRGDMLFQAPDAAAPVRLQGVFVSDGEIQDLVEYWRQHAFEMKDVNLHTPTATPVNMDMPLNAPLKQTPLFGENGDRSGGDPVLPEAVKIVREEGKASISMLQRKLRIGYTRAARLIDQLEEQGIIGPSQPTSQVREVLDFGEEHNAEADQSLGEM